MTIINTNEKSLLSYVVGETTDNITISLHDIVFEESDMSSLNDMIENKSFQFKVCVPIDFEKVSNVTPRLLGYEVAILEPPFGIPFYTAEAYLIEDFVDNINVGETDFDELKRLVLEPRTILINEIDGFDGSGPTDGVIDQQELTTFYNNTTKGYNNNFLKRDILTNQLFGKPVDIATKINNNSLVSAYSLPKQYTAAGADSNSSTIVLTDGSKVKPISLESLRATPEPIEVAEAFNAYEAAANFSNEDFEIDMGRVITYTSPSYISERIIEFQVPFAFAPEDLLHFRFRPIFEEDTDIIPSNETISVDSTSRYTSLIRPVIPCEIECLSSNPGSLTLRVQKRDPTLQDAQVNVVRKNLFTGEEVEISETTIDFREIKNAVIEVGNALNVHPFELTATVTNVIGNDLLSAPNQVSIPNNYVERSETFFTQEIVDESYFLLEITDEGVEVSISGIHPACNRVKVIREDLFGTGMEHVIYEGEPDFMIVDDKVLSRKSYKYKAIYRYHLSNAVQNDMPVKYHYQSYSYEGEEDTVSSKSSVTFEKLSRAEAFVDYIKPSAQEWNLSVDSNTIMVVDAQGDKCLGVRPIISQNFGAGDNDFESIVALLKTLPDIDFDDTPALQNRHIPILKVSRMNLVTLEIQDLGFTLGVGGRYILDKNIVKTLETNPGSWENKYRYEFRLCLPTIGALKGKFLEKNSTFTSANISELISEKKYQKYLSDDPFIDSLEVTKDQLGLGQVVDNSFSGKIAYFNYDPFAPSSNIQVSLIGAPAPNRVTLGFSIHYDAENEAAANNISAFMIYRKHLNLKELCHVMPKVNNDSSYTWSDFLEAPSLFNRVYNIFILTKQGTVYDSGAEYTYAPPAPIISSGIRKFFKNFLP